MVADYVAGQRATWQLRLTSSVTVADLTSNLAVQYGVTSEIFTTTDYGLTQLWASAFRHAGFGGIRYWARNDLSHTVGCLALFGVAGSPEHSAGFEVDATDHLLDRTALLDELKYQTGITVLPVPPI